MQGKHMILIYKNILVTLTIYKTIMISTQVRDYSTSETSNFRSVKVPPGHARGAFPQQPDWNPPRPPWPTASNHNGSGKKLS